MSTFLFDSRDDRCKTPFGAVPTDDVVTFRVFLPISYQLREPALLVYKADRWDSPERIPMHYEASDGVSCSYTCIFYSPDPQLYFYLFEVAGVNGKMRIARDQDGFGVLLPQGGEMWQLTVYDKAMRAPEFMKNGILYQIFPDRFCASGGAKSGVPSDRRLHRDWYELPEYLPDRNGEVTNSDYFGGDLRGITQKLTYLKSMGVGTIYLNPIFEAHSNHRYNTADYLKADPLLGTNEDFADLCAEAKRQGIRIILDGVFSHTGSYGVYFALFGFAAIFLFSSYNMLPTAHNNNNAIMKRAEKAEAAMAEYVKHYPHGAFPVKSWYAHPIVLKQMMDAVEEGRAVTVPEALDAVKARLKSLNADVEVEQEEYDEVVVIKALFLNHDYQ